VYHSGRRKTRRRRDLDACLSPATITYRGAFIRGFPSGYDGRGSDTGEGALTVEGGGMIKIRIEENIRYREAGSNGEG